MKKRYSEYVNYNYTGEEEWFNPQIEWDTPLFIDPMLLKQTKIREFKGCYDKIVNFFSKAIVKMNSTIPFDLKKQMVSFDEVKEANLGFSYDSNKGKGLTGKIALSVLQNIDKFVDSGLFGIEDFANISLLDKNVNCDRITDMIMNIIKDNFIAYSARIAKQNGFPIKKIRIKGEFLFEEMRWKNEMAELPFVINEKGKQIPVILVPKELLGIDVYCNSDNFASWLYSNELEYVKRVFNYNLKKDITDNKDKILEDIIKNRRTNILSRFIKSSRNVEPYDLNNDAKFVYKIYDLANDLYEKSKDYFQKTTINTSSLSVQQVAEILINDLKVAITDKKGYIIIKNRNNTFLSEQRISKLVHLLFEATIKDAGFNVDISPETNSGFGPVDFKISRGDDKVLIENKVSTNPKLKVCIDEDKQIHAYMKSEECKKAYLLVFIDKEKDIEKINQLSRKASKYNNYSIKVECIDCMDRLSASSR